MSSKAAIVAAILAVAALAAPFLAVSSDAAEGAAVTYSDQVDNDQGQQNGYTYTYDFFYRGTGAESILWDFGFDYEDGTRATSTEFNPKDITFPGKGQYIITQTVTNTSGSYTSRVTLNVLGDPEITFVSNGGSSVAKLTVDFGSVAQKPADPVKDGAVFAGWYKDSDLTVPMDWSAPVEEHMTLWAKWSDSVIGPGGEDPEDPAPQDPESVAPADDGVGLLVPAACAILGVLAVYVGRRDGSDLLLAVGLVLIAFAAYCLVTGFDVMDIIFPDSIGVEGV